MDKNGLPRCPHNVRASVVLTEDGWRTALGPVECGLCPVGEPVGLRFKLPHDEGGIADPVTLPETPAFKCPEPGCIVIAPSGIHDSPCLLDDRITIEVGHGAKWHALKYYLIQDGKIKRTVKEKRPYARTLCGVEGVVTDSQPGDAVDCAKCRKAIKKGRKTGGLDGAW